ncbi:MAG: hypothetical protein B1H03_05675 [Planctomycetales bacterium 4484_113]|nr:MAG: hypothetical protein B1H03_05675 [Planctomycetales bacterium 4484_113]
MDTDPLSTGSILVIWGLSLLSLGVLGLSSACRASILGLSPGDIALFEEKGEGRGIQAARYILRRPALALLAYTTAMLIGFAAALGLSFFAIFEGVHLSLLQPFWLRVVIELVVLVALALFLLVFGYLLPVLLLARAEFLVRNGAAAQFLFSLAYPLAWLLALAANSVGKASDYPRVLGLADLDVYPATAPAEEELEEEEKEMISAIVEMGETTAREIMRPRIDIVALDADDPPSKLISQVVEASYSRFPVFSGTIDNIVGVLHIRDLLTEVTGDAEQVEVRRICKQPFFIPESKRIDELLRELQLRKVHMAIVTDEYGGTAGLVTIEDILEEIVGEIQDEYDEEAQPVQRKEDGSFVVSGALPMEEFNEETGLSLEAEGNDTLAGLLYDKFGKIPQQGDVIHINGVKFTILRVDGNRIRLAQVEVV